MAQQIHSGTRTVTTAGTAVRLRSTKTESRTFVVQAKAANTGNVYIRGIGDDGGIELMAYGTATFNAMGSNAHFDLKEIHLDADVSGEGVNLLWYSGD